MQLARSSTGQAQRPSSEAEHPIEFQIFLTLGRQL